MQLPQFSGSRPPIPCLVPHLKLRFLRGPSVVKVLRSSDAKDDDSLGTFILSEVLEQCRA